MVRWSRWSEIYCGGKRRCGSLCSQGTPAAHFEGISKGWNRTALWSDWAGRMINRACQVVSPPCSECARFNWLATPIQFNSQLTHDAAQLRYVTVLPDQREATQNNSHANHLFSSNNCNWHCNNIILTVWWENIWIVMFSLRLLGY